MGLMDRLQNRRRERELTAAYQKNTQAIESQWAVVSNLGDFHGPQGQELERLCLETIQILHAYLALHPEGEPGWLKPRKVPAYIRLAMLCEHRGDYDKAVEVCCAAIRAGATEDGNQSRMFGRLARMMKKANRPLTPDIEALLALQ